MGTRLYVSVHPRKFFLCILCIPKKNVVYLVCIPKFFFVYPQQGVPYGESQPLSYFCHGSLGVHF